MLLCELGDWLLYALALENHAEEFYLTLQDPSIAQGVHSELLQVFVLQHEQTVAFNGVVPEVFDAIPEAYLVEPGADLRVAPLANLIRCWVTLSGEEGGIDVIFSEECLRADSLRFLGRRDGAVLVVELADIG